MSKATNQIAKFTSGIKAIIVKAQNKDSMQVVADFAVNLVVKRTRLGYGVSDNYGTKSRLAKLSDKYILSRKKTKIDSTTTAKKSNLTRTGQMLRSMQGKYLRRGVIEIAPTGDRDDGLTNLEVAEFAQTRPGLRPFNRVSRTEFTQIVRFFRKEFGDLTKRSAKGRLIR